jgi:hypothetical protein
MNVIPTKFSMLSCGRLLPVIDVDAEFIEALPEAAND